jgi:hypothetical protein
MACDLLVSKQSPPTFLVQHIAQVLVVVPILYAWGGICFLYFRFSQKETEERLRNFLEYHRPFFLGRRPADNKREVNKQVVRKAGSHGWNFVLLPLFSVWLDDHWHYWTFLPSVAVLFFGGLMFAYSWYGLRCLRLLKLESFEGAPQGSMAQFKSVESLVSQNKKIFALSAVIVALGIFGGYFYMNRELGLPLWMLLFDFVLYAIFLYALWWKLLKA